MLGVFLPRGNGVTTLHHNPLVGGGGTPREGKVKKVISLVHNFLKGLSQILEQAIYFPKTCFDSVQTGILFWSGLAHKT